MLRQFMSIAVEKRRRTRISHSKVRTGCLTCRNRHIKCDEGQPTCSQCTKGGHVCEYRQTLDGRTRASRMAKGLVVGTQSRAAHRLNPALGSQVDLTWRERYFLDFFRNSTSLQCAGYFHDEFWERLVHQASEFQPAIRHAVIGMGSLNYHFAQTGRSQLRFGSNRTPSIEPFSLQQINKAIASLQQNMSDDSMGRLRVETALVACVVLISTLLFQEDATLAGRHLFSGYRLLEHYLISHGSNSLFAATITRAFGVIHLTWTLFTSAEPPDKDARLPLLVPETIIRGGDDIQTANDLVVTLIRIGCSQNWAQGFNIGPASPDLDIDQMAIVRQIQRIPSQIQAYRVLHAHQSTQRDLSAFLILQLWAEVISITATVETGPEPQEMIFDRYIVRFKEALEISKELLMRISSTPSFSVNLGVIPPLFVLAMKCRDWEIRRQIVDLLRVFRRQEGIWSTDLAALITERVIDIESAGFGPGDLIPESSRIKSLLVDAMTTKSQVPLRYHFVRDCPGFCCNHAEPYEEEILSYASGRFEILECSRRP